MKTHGLWTKQNDLRFYIRADSYQLNNAPLGPIQKTRLRRQIERQKAELKVVNAKLRSLRSKQNKRSQP